MEFERELVAGRFVRRYKRFFADVELEGGEMVTAHCPNSGSMKSCLEEGWPVLISTSDNPGRKLPFTLEMAHNHRCWIGLNTIRTNRIVEEAVRKGEIPELSGYDSLERERPYGKEKSRIDLLLSGKKGVCYVEVKSVTLLLDGDYQFPDAVTERGRKHLRELAEVARSGERALLFYLVQRSDGRVFRPAKSIDPAYATAMEEAYRAGVEFLAYGAKVSPEGIAVDSPVTMVLEGVSPSHHLRKRTKRRG